MHALQNSIVLEDGSTTTPRFARLFSMVSIPSLQLRYFPVVKQGFHSLWHNCNLGAASRINLTQRSPDEEFYRAYFWLFDFKKLGCVPLNQETGRPFSPIDPFRRIGLQLSDITDVRRGKFNILFSTDGTGTSFNFIKAVSPPPEPDPLDVQYQRLGFDPDYDAVGFADPGVRDPFNLYFPSLKKKTVEENDEMEDQDQVEYELEDDAAARVVTMSTKEFYHLSYRNHSKSKRELYLKEHDRNILLQENQLEFINSQCPTPKALYFEGFLAFFAYKIQHLNLFIAHYDRRYRVLLMRNYIGNLFISMSLSNLLFNIILSRQTRCIGRSLQKIHCWIQEAQCTAIQLQKASSNDQ
jgi:hypothetical protein